MFETSAKERFLLGIRDGLPICLGYVPVAFAFGIFCINSNLFWWQALLISMTNVTSAGQLAAVPIIAGGLSFAELALSQLIINMRYALMSISLSQKLSKDVTLLDRFIIAFVNTDEVFAVASGQKGLVGRHYLYGLITTPFLGWSFGTLLGAVAGNVLPAVVVNALGIAIYGMFIAIIIPKSKESKSVFASVLLASFIAVLFAFVPALKIVSSGFVIIIASVISATLLAIFCPIPVDVSSQSKDEVQQ